MNDAVPKNNIVQIGRESFKDGEGWCATKARSLRHFLPYEIAAMLHKRWGVAPQSCYTGGGSKPP
ncbi:hypothetical protein [Desulfosporosinus fructosivorans]